MAPYFNNPPALMQSVNLLCQLGFRQVQHDMLYDQVSAHFFTQIHIYIPLQLAGLRHEFCDHYYS